MDWLTDPLNYLMVKFPWLVVLIIIMREFATMIKNVRDAIDKTPESDDNWFERLATIISKAVKGYAVGIRPQAPKEVQAQLGTVANAAGVKVEEKQG